MAQSTGGSDDAPPESAARGGYWASVNANNVFVRSSPSVQSSYPFGRLAAGDVVEVLEESYGWARVRCTGPAFESIVGYVPADRRVELSPDGLTLRVTARTEVKAPNISSRESPDASWKPIARLAAGDVLTVLGTVEGEREKVYKVRLPESAEGFVNLNYLRRASNAEVAAARERRSAAPMIATPAPAPPVATRTAATSGDAASPATARADAKRAASENNDGSRPRRGQHAVVEVDEEVVAIDTPEGEVVAERTEVVTRPREPETPPVSRAAREAAANRAEFEDLEATWAVVRTQSLEHAEISVLRQRYADLITRPNVPAEIRQMAQARVQQLGLKLEVQERIYALERLKAQRGQDLDRLRAIALAMEARSDYDAVGVLNASTVFDGRRLPALYRLQDPAVGQTIAYVAPGDDIQLSTMLGVLVGIRGQKRFDEPLRVTVIEPRTVDILTQRREPQISIMAPAESGSGPGSRSAGTNSQGVSSISPPASLETFAPVPPDAP